MSIMYIYPHNHWLIKTLKYRGSGGPMIAFSKKSVDYSDYISGCLTRAFPVKNILDGWASNKFLLGGGGVGGYGAN